MNPDRLPTPDIEVIGTVGSLAEARERMARSPGPDVIDIHLLVNGASSVVIWTTYDVP